MKKFSKITAAVVAAASMAGSAYAATSIVSGASATIIGPLSISNTTPLNFGSFSSGSTAGTINSFGAVTGGVTLVSIGQPAAFNVTGNPNTNFFVTSPTSVVLTSGANSMTASLTAPPFSALDNAGNRTINVLGTLNVAANQPAGTYTGSYTVSVNY